MCVLNKGRKRGRNIANKRVDIAQEVRGESTNARKYGAIWAIFINLRDKVESTGYWTKRDKRTSGCLVNFPPPGRGNSYELSGTESGLQRSNEYKKASVEEKQKSERKVRKFSRGNITTMTSVSRPSEAAANDAC